MYVTKGIENIEFDLNFKSSTVQNQINILISIITHSGSTKTTFYYIILTAKTYPFFNVVR